MGTILGRVSNTPTVAAVAEHLSLRRVDYPRSYRREASPLPKSGRHHPGWLMNTESPVIAAQVNSRKPNILTVRCRRVGAEMNSAVNLPSDFHPSLMLCRFGRRWLLEDFSQLDVPRFD
jgi:hypothetical protein